MSKSTTPTEEPTVSIRTITAAELDADMIVREDDRDWIVTHVWQTFDSSRPAAADALLNPEMIVSVEPVTWRQNNALGGFDATTPGPDSHVNWSFEDPNEPIQVHA